MENQNKFTPGPWTVRDDSDKAPFTYRVRADLSGRKHKSTDESVCITGTEANARLIAAAPELLAALRELIVSHEMGDTTPEAYSARVESARRAYLKATGGAE